MPCTNCVEDGEDKGHRLLCKNPGKLVSTTALSAPQAIAYNPTGVFRPVVQSTRSSQLQISQQHNGGPETAYGGSESSYRGLGSASKAPQLAYGDLQSACGNSEVVLYQPPSGQPSGSAPSQNANQHYVGPRRQMRPPVDRCGNEPSRYLPAHVDGPRQQQAPVAESHNRRCHRDEHEAQIEMLERRIVEMTKKDASRQEAEHQAYRRGRDRGYDEGHQHGYDRGFRDGSDRGSRNEYHRGYDDALDVQPRRPPESHCTRSHRN